MTMKDDDPTQRQTDLYETALERMSELLREMAEVADEALAKGRILHQPPQSGDWDFSKPVSSKGLIPFDLESADFCFWVKCDSCENRMDVCGVRAKGQKFDIGDSYRCIECQDATGVEPVFVEGYASETTFYRTSGPVNGNDANRYHP